MPLTNVMNLITLCRELSNKNKELVEQSKNIREKILVITAMTKLISNSKLKYIIKTCSCGQTYTPSQWSLQDFIGYQTKVEGIHGEMRHCKCGSTLFFVSKKDPIKEIPND